ncbi:ankyrin repeat domain-containing protein [Arthrobacter jiangjiafuii]|uniref:Ankyrin repeat domain-containing protein n=1 Tax=Arthrobacter jiangjiafuii TaxID=2817475 RepID=A0A975R0J9_9MICC|nr:ankyrin repeat domain-containing protein [Arthrobacter jiangjiafuii]QWC09514.1 ankyrin repeat domain-containing protein [Arthrobacter jiangjiafuii]
MTDPARPAGSAADPSPDVPDAAATAEAADPRMLELAESLFEAARSGDIELLRSYLDAGVPVSLTNAAGDSLLMLAAYHGHAGLAALLVERGADVNTLNDRGQSPLAGAVFKGYADVVRVLVAAGADADSGNPSARATAQYFARPELLELL